MAQDKDSVITNQLLYWAKQTRYGEKLIYCQLEKKKKVKKSYPENTLVINNTSICLTKSMFKSHCGTLEVVCLQPLYFNI